MADKGFEADDPMALVGVGVGDGDAELMATCLVEEFVLLGLDDAQLLRLFATPAYAGAHALFRARGEAWVRALIGRVRAERGYPRYTVRETGEG